MGEVEQKEIERAPKAGQRWCFKAGGDMVEVTRVAPNRVEFKFITSMNFHAGQEGWHEPAVFQEFYKPAPAQSPAEAAAIAGNRDPAECDHQNADILADRCLDCGASAEQVFVAQARADRMFLAGREPLIPKRQSELRSSLAAEQSLTTAQRRARLGKFDGGPWQQWPKGDDDEP